MDIIVLHCGNQPYVKKLLQYNQKHNPSHSITLIGNKENKNFCNKWADWDSYVSKKAYDFRSVYGHLSFNSLEYELRCFERFFVLYEYMKQNHIESCIHLDSDVMLCTSIEESWFENYDLCYSGCQYPVYFGECISAHLSYWKITVLKDFLDYVMDFYLNRREKLKEIYNYHKEHEVLWVSAICDMVILTAFVQEKKYHCLNLNRLQLHKVFDHNISVGDNEVMNEYEFDHILHIKCVSFKQGIPYFIRVENQEKIQALSLHLQGASKKYYWVFIHSWSGKCNFFLMKCYRRTRFMLGKVKRRLHGS